MSEVNDPTSSDQLCETNCTAGLDFDDSTGDEWDQLKIVAIVIPIVILLLTGIVIFAIYCFKKKADKAEQANKQINDRLPVIGVQGSTRTNGNYSNGNRKSIIPSSVESYSKMEYSNEVYDPKFGHQLGGTNCNAADVSSDDTMHYAPIRHLTIYDRNSGYQLGGTNCTAAVTNFERSSECYSDSCSECKPEPDRSTCSVSE